MDLDQFIFLVGGSNGEPLFQPPGGITTRIADAGTVGAGDPVPGPLHAAKRTAGPRSCRAK
jgi:hypothetical protein